MKIPIQLNLKQIYIKLIKKIQIQYKYKIFLFISFTSYLIKTKTIKNNHKKIITHQIYKL